jgi:hypothetical protein
MDQDAFVTVSSNTADTFTNASNNDMLIYTETSNQRILIGTRQNAPAAITISSNIIDFQGIVTRQGQPIGTQFINAGSNIYVLGSNLGIGLSNPPSLIGIHDSNNPTNAAITFSSTQSQARVGLSSNSALLIWHHSNNDIKFGTSNREVFTITSNGNIGIMRTNPGYTLDVNGSINFSGSLFQNGTLFTSSGAGGGGTGGTGAFQSYLNTLYLLDSNIGLGTQTTNPNTLLHVHSPINAFIGYTNPLTGDGIAYTGVDSNGSMIIWHTSNNPLRFGVSNKEAMRISSSNLYVGINTPSPQKTLDVAGDINFTGALYKNGALYVGSQWSNNSTSVFLTNSTVGIGTSNPQAQLHVTSNIRVDGPLQVNALQMTGIDLVPGLTPNNFTQIYGIASNIQGFSNIGTGIQFYVNKNTDIFQFVSGSNVKTEVFRVAGNGNTGIRNSNPQQALDVIGNINFTGSLLQNGTPINLTDTWSSNNFVTTSNLIYPRINTTSNIATWSSNNFATTSNQIYAQANATSNTAFWSSNNFATTSNVIHARINTNSNTAFWSSNNFATTSNQLYPRINTNSNTAFWSSNNLFKRTGDTISGQLTSTVASGTAPFVITSTTLNTNMNADLLDGQHGTFYQNADNINTGTLPVSYGGTGASFLKNGSILVGNGEDFILAPINLTWDSENSRLDVTGDINFTGSLLKDYSPYIATQWSNNSSNVFILNSNVGFNTSNTVPYTAEVFGSLGVTSLQQVQTPIRVPPGPIDVRTITSNINGITYTFTTQGGYAGDSAWTYDGDNTTLTWHDDGYGTYSTSTGVYQGTASQTGGISGVWLQIQTSVPWVMTSYTLASSEPFRKWYVFGSTNGSSWTQLDYEFYASWTFGSNLTKFTINNTSQFSYHRFVVNETYNTSTFNFHELFYEGYRFIPTQLPYFLASNNFIGINTSNPTQPLDVTGNINFTGALLQNNIAYNMTPSNIITSNIQLNPSDTSALPSFTWQTDTNTGMYHFSSDAIGFSTNGNFKMVIGSNVGINTTNPIYPLQVMGSNITDDVSIFSERDVAAFSDGRYKENLQVITNALSNLDIIHGYTFNWHNSTRRSAGVIAQEIRQVLPEVVHEDPEGKLSVSYGNMISFLIQAMKEMKKEIADLKRGVRIA